MLDSFQQCFEVVAADDVALRRTCFRLRYQVYCVENPFEDPGAFPDRCETDEFDRHSVHALMVDRQTDDPIGTCRVVLPFDRAKGCALPLQLACSAPWTRDAGIFPPGRVGEISRFCIAKAYRKGRMIGEAKLGLLRMAFRLALEHRLTHVACVMDPLLLRLFDRLGLDFGPQGDPIEYHGLRQPCVSGIRELFAKLRAKREDVWRIVTDDGELWEMACALEGQVAAIPAWPLPFRFAAGTPVPLSGRVQLPMAMAL